jgi:hypothetical protein
VVVSVPEPAMRLTGVGWSCAFQGFGLGL